MRFFNTSGPVKPTRHYCIPPLDRSGLGEVLGLVEQEQYFVLHAPRQSGKTSTLLALRDWLNANGGYRCVYASFETGQSAGEDVERALRAWRPGPSWRWTMGSLTRRGLASWRNRVPTGP